MAAKQFAWIGQGPIDFGIFDPTNGTADQGYITGKKKVGCSNSSLVLNVSSEEIELKETCSGKRASLYSVTLSQSIEVTLEMKEFSAAELAIAFVGDHQSVSAGSVTGEVIVKSGVSVGAGEVVHTKHPLISNVVIKDSAGTALVEGTDYVIESANHGKIKFLASKTGTLTIDYDYASYENIAALAGQVVERGLVFNGISGTGVYQRITIPRVNWRLEGDFGLIGDDYSTLTLKGKVLYVDLLASDAWFGGFMRIDALPSE